MYKEREGSAYIIIGIMPIHTDLALGEGDLSLLTWILDRATAPASSFAFLPRAFPACKYAGNLSMKMD